MPDIDTTNFEKFQTGNPLVRLLISRFFRRVEARVARLGMTSLLDAGCGEGESLARLCHVLPPRVEGFDINSDCVAYTQKRHPQFQFRRESIYELPYKTGDFDAVICLEVLEHLERPQDALKELLRVTRRDVIVSVPHEPWFRLGNLLRGKYKETWGNHPEHIQQWNPRTFGKFLAAQSRVVWIGTSFPWIIAHCRKRGRR